MNISSTDAKNRFGQVLEQAQKRPVFIEKSGRRHSVVLSQALYDELMAAARPPASGEISDEARAFYAKYKDWVDMHNDLVERHGVFGEEYRTW